VRHIVVIYLDEDKRARLPAPVRFVMDTVDKPLSKLPTRRMPRILTMIFGGIILAGGIAYSNNPDAFMKALRGSIDENPEVRTAFEKAKDDLERSVGVFVQAEAAARDEEEFYDAESL